MGVTEEILKRLQALPESALAEVLRYVEELESRDHTCAVREAEAEWRALSLSSAMRGMEDEASEYSEADLKEVFT